MSAGGARTALRSPLSILVAGPLIGALIAVAASVALDWPARQGDDRARAEQVEARFADLLTDAAGLAASALVTSPTQALEQSAGGAQPLAARIEGLLTIDARGHALSWSGTPAEPAPALLAGPGPEWAVRLDGVRTRLLARSGPDDQGRSAVASVILDTTLDDLPFAALLPPSLGQGITVLFLDGAAGDEAWLATLPERGAGAVWAPLRTPRGRLLGAARLSAAPGALAPRALFDRALAVAALLLIVLALALFDWPAASERPAGLLLVVALVLAGRTLLILADTTALLLPRSLGTASVFGTAAYAGWLRSPADLLLSAAALLLLSTATRRAANALARRARSSGALLAAGGALGATAAAACLALCIATDARIPLLDRPAPFHWNAELALWCALALALIGAAQLWGALAGIAFAPRASAAREGASGTGWMPVAVAFLGLAVATTILLQVASEREALEQLRSQYAPQVLEQSARRGVALRAALREIQDRFAADDLPALASSDSLAYQLWSAGELFHSGYKSAIDVYGPDGTIVSRFSFGIPPLAESLAAAGPPARTIDVRNETFEPVPALERDLLHAEAALLHDGTQVGTLIAHVLDEPDNLPFLPWSQPYLSALGPPSARSDGQEFGGGPQYVLYDAAGAILLTTLRQPPAHSAAVERAAERQRTLTLEAGDERFVGLALAESARSHLLLLPTRSPLERLAGSVRLAVLGLALLGLGTALRLVTRPAAWDSLRASLTGSFYRKLLATLLVASVVPLIGLALFLRGYIERRGEVALVSQAAQLAGVAQRVVEDYSATIREADEEGVRLNDFLLYWLRGVVGQEIHVFREGWLEASSKRELFTSGLLPERLDGAVQEALVTGGLPYLVQQSRLGAHRIPVAYAPVRSGVGLVIAVPLVLQQRQIERAIARLVETVLLATVALGLLQAFAAARLARTVARPVRELVEATGKIAGGHYDTRLAPRTRDELADLVRSFNAMAAALGAQRADLERRRDYTEALLRHATAGVISVDRTGRVVTLNPAAGQLLAGTVPPLGEGLDLAAALDGSDELRPLAGALARRSPPGEPVDVDLRRAGEARRLRLVRVGLPDGRGGSVGELILLDDVTDFMRSNQLAAWAEMARAIAHEIKNPLTPIQLSAEHAQRVLRERHDLQDAEVDACLVTIIKQVRALYEIAGEFSAFAKLPVLAPRPTDPVAFLRATVGPYRSAAPPGIRIEEAYTPAPDVAIDPKVLGRAVINLIENALDAMGSGGTLTVSVRPHPERHEVELAVHDTGGGLAPEVRARLFEPYFSTKSSGTGLGLAIARRAVEAHRGRLEVGDRPGPGTTFEIHLPAALDPGRDGA